MHGSVSRLRFPNRDKPAATRVRAVKSAAGFCSKLGEEMSELVTQRAIDFLGMLNQPRV